MIAIVGNGPSARQPQGYDHIICVNEAPFVCDTRLIIDERAIPKVTKMLPRAEEFVLSLIAFNSINDLLGDEQSSWWWQRISVRRTTRYPKGPGHLYAGPGGVLSSALSYVSRDIGGWEDVDLYGFDFFEPSGSERRNLLLQQMRETILREIEAEVFWGVNVRWIDG